MNDDTQQKIVDIRHIFLMYELDSITSIEALKKIDEILNRKPPKYDIDWQNDSLCFYREIP